MNKKKIVALLAAGLLTFNTISSISNVNVFAAGIENYNLVMEEEIPQSQMKAVATSSQPGEEGDKAIDGNLETMWHTPWGQAANFPESLTIDLGGSNNVSSIVVSPRISGDNGSITKYEIYAINGNEETLIASGNWKGDNNAKTVEFASPVKAEKIKISALAGKANFASIAEVNIYRVKENVEKLASYENKKITDNQGIDISSNLESLKNLEEGTIIARFDTTKTGIQSLISIGNNNVANGHFNFYIDDNAVGFEVRNQSGNVATGKASAVLNKGINTVALKVISGVGYKIFINGVLAGQVSTSAATLSAGVVDVNNAYIGKTDRSTGNEYNFGGCIDFIDVYGEVVSDKYLLELTGQTALPTEDEILPDGYKSEVVDLFTPGDLNSPNFRIPALFTTKAGTVIASIDVRNNGGHDAPNNNIDAAIRRKPLNGEWEDAQVVIDLPSKAAVIDTSLTQNKETGRIFLLVTTFAEGYGFPNVQQGSGYTEVDGVRYRSLYNASGALYTIREEGNVYDSEGKITDYKVDLSNMNLTKGGVDKGNVMLSSCELKIPGTSFLSLIHSDDDGVTWSDPIDVTGQVKSDWMKFLGTGPGAGIQIKNGDHKGRIVFPVYYTNTSNIQSSAVIYSDDNGETWKMGESPNDGRDLGNGQSSNSQTMTSGLHLTESQVVEMPDGQLKLFMRNTGSYVRIATSFDGGATWDADVYEDRNLPEPYCQLSVINYSEKIDGKDAIVFSNPAGSGRNNGTVRFGLITENGTHANGKTKYTFDWKYNKLVKPGTFAYSCLTELPNKGIGLFYEGTGSEEMSYVEMSPEYIKFNYEASVESLVEEAKIESIEILGDKENYNPGENIEVNLTFDQGVSLIGDKNITLKLGESEIVLTPVEQNSAKQFKYEGKLPTDLAGGTYNLTLKANSNIEILNTVAKNTTFDSDIDLSEIGGQITIAGEAVESPDGNPEENVELVAEYNNIIIRNNEAFDISDKINGIKDLTEGTIIARFDNTNKSGIQSIIGIGNKDAAYKHFHLYTNGDKVGFELRNNSNIVNSSDAVANVTLNNGINTVAFKVTNGEGYKIFVNGVMILDLKDSNARFLDAVEGINSAYIGKTPRSAGQNVYNFNGDVDFVEIYKTTLKDEVLLSRTSETKLVSDLETTISNVEIIDEKDSYLPGDKIKVKLTANQTVSLVGENDLTLKIGDSEVPFTLVKGESSSEFVFEAILPENLSVGTQALAIKANANTTILNTAGNNITLSSDLALNKSINIAGEEDEKVVPSLSLIAPSEVKVGEEFEVKVNVANLEDKYAMEFDVEYDDVKTELKSVDSVVEGKYIVNHKVEDGKVKVVVASLGAPIDSALDFIKLVFEAKESGENITFTTSNSNVGNGEGDVVEVENATVSVKINENIDKTGLTEVIENAKELAKNEDNKYTEASINALKEAITIAEGVANNEEATQEQVNVAKDALQNAIDSLKVVDEPAITVDKTALNITIEYATKLKENGALEGVVEAVATEYNKALANALNVYNNESSTEAEVKDAFDKLTLAIHMLEFKAGDKTELKNLIDSIEALKENVYTEDSWANLQGVLSEAVKIFEDVNAMEDEVNEVTEKLQQAIQDLELKNDVNKSLLQGLVNKVKDTEESKYIASSWVTFAEALKNSNDILAKEDATQEEVDSSYNSLLKAYLGLRLTPDKSALEDLINRANSVDLSKYTRASVKNFNDELKKANEVFSNEEATKAEIEEVTNNLNIAMANLEEKTVASSNGGSNNSNKGNKLPNTGAVVSSTMTSLLAGLSAIGGALMMKKRKNK